MAERGRGCSLGSGDLQRRASTTREARGSTPAHDRSDSRSCSARGSRCGVQLVSNVLLFPCCPSSASSVSVVKERSAVRTEVLVGSFLRRPTLVEAGLDPAATGAPSVETRRKSCSRNAKLCFFPRSVSLRLQTIFSSLLCDVASNWPRTFHTLILNSRNEGRADQFGIEQVLIGPLRNVHLSHESRVAACSAPARGSVCSI